MAGFYPDAPAPRIPYDRDGTIGAILNANANGIVTLPLSNAVMRALNSEGFTASAITANQYGALMFPRKMDIFGVLGRTPSGGGGSLPLRYSTDTTNFIDGTWSTGTYQQYNGGSDQAALRTGITAVSLIGVRALALRTNQYDSSGNSMSVMHLYGVPSAGEDPDRLRIWHPTLDEEVGPAYFDWGDAAQNQPSTKDFRVKNNSATLTATTITVSADVLTEASPTIEDQYTFDDGGGYAATATIASLAPGAISGVITVRRTRPADAALSLWWARIIADAASMGV